MFTNLSLNVDTNSSPETMFLFFMPSQATLAQGVNSLTAELEGVEKLSDEVLRMSE